jgi:hypothetical protein
MQTRIDWTTGGLSFYDVDPPKSEKREDFTPDYDVNSQFDPIPSSYFTHHTDSPSKSALNSSSQWAQKS